MTEPHDPDKVADKSLPNVLEIDLGRNRRWFRFGAFVAFVLVVAAALLDPDGRVLIAQRPPGKGSVGQAGVPPGLQHTSSSQV